MKSKVDQPGFRNDQPFRTTSLFRMTSLLQWPAFQSKQPFTMTSLLQWPAFYNGQPFTMASLLEPQSFRMTSLLQWPAFQSCQPFRLALVVESVKWWSKVDQPAFWNLLSLLYNFTFLNWLLNPLMNILCGAVRATSYKNSQSTQ